MNIPCCRTMCEHNTGNYEKQCMLGVSADLIRFAKSDKPMCEYLRKKVLKLEKEFREVFESE